MSLTVFMALKEARFLQCAANKLDRFVGLSVHLSPNFFMAVNRHNGFKPLPYVVPHFFGARQSHRSGTTQCLAIGKQRTQFPV